MIHAQLKEFKLLLKLSPVVGGDSGVVAEVAVIENVAVMCILILN